MPLQFALFWTIVGFQGIAGTTSNAGHRGERSEQSIAQESNHENQQSDDVERRKEEAVGCYESIRHQALDCSFEGTLCRWVQSNSDSLDWSLHTNSTTAAFGGSSAAAQLPNGEPNVDYLYLDASHGYHRQTADLESPLLNLQQPVCLNFWSFLSGYDVERLDVMLLDPSTKQETLLLRKTGNVQTNTWTESALTITAPAPTTPVQVIFRAVKGDFVIGNVAIDVIRGLSGSCEQNINNGLIG